MGGIDFYTKTFQVFYVCAGLLTLKMLFMVPLIGRLRFLKKIVLSPEDTKLLKGLKVKHDDPDIERVRRAHLNDVENIPIFLTAACLYTALQPSPVVAIPLLIIYTIARFAHTYVYAMVVMKQPARFICYAVGYAITAYMAAYVATSVRDDKFF